VPTDAASVSRIPSESQRTAIEAPPQALLVLAGPGAGKTFCLIERIRSRGDRPFLTVRTDNTRAVEIYHRLGFKERTLLYSRTVRRAQS